VSGVTCPGTNCTVKTIYDLTAGLHCTSAVCDMTQATVADRPAFLANCVSTTPCMQFTAGAAGFLQNTNGLTSVSQPLTLVAASTQVSGTNEGVVFSGGGGPPTLQYSGSANSVSAGCGSTGVSSATNGTFYSLILVCNGASTAFYVNAASNAFSGGADALAGNIYTGYQGNVIQVLEVGAYPNGFTSGQASVMSASQRSRGGY
jgi:hypothetical protein